MRNDRIDFSSKYCFRRGPNGIGFIQSREHRGTMYSVTAFLNQTAIADVDKGLLRILLGLAS